METVFTILIVSYICIGPTLGTSYTNPVIDANYPDPGVLALPGKGYAVVVSSGEDPDAFPLAYSTDLINWTPQGHVFPVGSWPVWTDTNMWAPEIHLVSGRYLCYFSASHANGRHSIGVAVSESGTPWGPYRDLGAPLVFHNEDSVVGLIDPSYFHDPEIGKHYALWKGDTWAPIRISAIYIRELDEGGMSFVEGSEPQILLQDDQHDELLIVEGPWMMYKAGQYYLFYSSSWVQLPSYHVGVARADRVLGPYNKRNIPVLQNDWERYNNGLNSTYEGPGHGSVVADHAGDWWLVYASWKYGHLDREPGRVMLLDRIIWTGAPLTEFWPYIGVPSDTLQDGPIIEMRSRGKYPSNTWSP